MVLKIAKADMKRSVFLNDDEFSKKLLQFKWTDEELADQELMCVHEALIAARDGHVTTKQLSRALAVTSRWMAEIERQEERKSRKVVRERVTDAD